MHRHNQNIQDHLMDKYESIHNYHGLVANKNNKKKKMIGGNVSAMNGYDEDDGLGYYDNANSNNEGGNKLSFWKR
jgi:hypothetical protein